MSLITGKPARLFDLFFSIFFFLAIPRTVLATSINTSTQRIKEINHALDMVEVRLEKTSVPQISQEDRDALGTHHMTENSEYSTEQPTHSRYPQEKAPGGVWEVNNKLFQADISLSGGLRVDQFDWSIAGETDGSSPNVLSELSWKDLKMNQVKLKADLTVVDKFLINMMGATSDIYDGSNQDSDYFGDNRSLEFSRSNNNSEDGEMYDLSLALGYRFYLNEFDPDFLGVDNLRVDLLAGYSQHQQHLIMTDGMQTVPALGSFDRLHSTYESVWEGPWAGVKLFGEYRQFTASLGFEYHWADYEAFANWNLRNDFLHPRSYMHQSEGVGLVYSFSGGYKLNSDWSIDTLLEIQDWSTQEGLDRVFFANGVQSDTQLNGVNWESIAYLMGMTYHFE